MTNTPPVGVLMVNLGTPEAPTPAAVRRYLAEFLSDRRVVEIPRLIWLPILYGLVLTLRPRKTARNYAAIWGDDGSPLLVISRRQATALQAELGDQYAVSLAMRYGRPDIAAALHELRSRGCQQMLILPMYPQYSATTTASVLDGVCRALDSFRDVPALHFIRDYHAHPGYIDALTQSIEQHWQKEGRGQKLLLSFHGIPQRNADLGDPYPRQCEQTAHLLAQRLGLQDRDWAMSYQSRFGKAPWLQPYTDRTLQNWAAAGLQNVDVVCPGFSADCLETLEEIAVENAGKFRSAGGGQLNYIPALNERDAHVRSLAALVRHHSHGWIESL